MINIKTANDFRFQARQSNFLKGLINNVLLPRIEQEANFGKYNVEIFLTNFPQASGETRKDLLEFLRSKGFKASIGDNEILKIDWA